MLFAHAYPAYVRRIVNIEGNFTLDDAFWSASVGRMSQSEADAMLKEFRADPLAWISGSVIAPAPRLRGIAARWLDHQPASTLRAMGQSVVSTTGNDNYLTVLEQVFDKHPVYLLSGEHSRKGWNVPDWAREKCAGDRTLTNSGHLMMLDEPSAFSATIKRSGRIGRLLSIPWDYLLATNGHSRWADRSSAIAASIKQSFCLKRLSNRWPSSDSLLKQCDSSQFG